MRERIHRSMSLRSAKSGIPGSFGSNALSDAYVVKKLNVFQSVAKVSRIAESIAPRLARVEVHGEPCENIHQRSGSAPRELSTSHGSMTLPRDLRLLLPGS